MDTMLDHCWGSVCDAGTTVVQLRIRVCRAWRWLAFRPRPDSSRRGSTPALPVDDQAPTISQFSATCWKPVQSRTIHPCVPASSNHTLNSPSSKLLDKDQRPLTQPRRNGTTWRLWNMAGCAYVRYWVCKCEAVSIWLLWY